MKELEQVYVEQYDMGYHRKQVFFKYREIGSWNGTFVEYKDCLYLRALRQSCAGSRVSSSKTITLKEPRIMGLGTHHVSESYIAGACSLPKIVNLK